MPIDEQIWNIVRNVVGPFDRGSVQAILDELLERSPSINYVADRRMVFDGDVVTTTASMPVMLALHTNCA